MKKSGVFSLTVVVAALGYFVDIYDLQLFNLVADKSLRGIGIEDPQQLAQYNYTLFLWQMGGMLAGGVLWGILGDKRGRKSILFGSILLYSIANILNGLVTDIHQYEAVRFFAGLGLAGELGAAITLVSEVMDKQQRGWGTMIIVTVGALGAVAANLLAKNLDWQISYFVGGGLGLALLALRVGTFESTMFAKVKESAAVKKGHFLSLFLSRERAVRYLCCILVGLPVWFVIGILIKFAPAFAKATGVTGAASAGDAIMYAYVGLSVGDLLSGAASQWSASRRKVVIAYLIACAALTVAYVTVQGLSLEAFYVLCLLLGAATGYWALFVTIAAEQFGTNIRATVTTTVPNFVRGAVIPITLSYKALEPARGPVTAGLIVGAACIALAMASILMLKETFGRELDYIEEEGPGVAASGSTSGSSA
ncbi:MAG: MFS transporter [Myxococcaceae bacterium]|nr:MFS transporter [Myxococcaceae bacterium]